MSPQEHLSYLALDQIALGQAPSADEQAHLASCGRCTQHVRRVSQRIPIPAWAKELEGRPVTPWARFADLARMRSWAIGLAGAVGLAAGVLLTIQLVPEEPGYTTVRGNPSVAVIVKRDNRLFQWSEEKILHPGDKIRIKVSPDGFGHVAVYSLGSGGKLSLLYSGTVAPQGETAIPSAWMLDAAPGPERLVVVLGREAIEEADVLKHERNSADLFVRHFSLQKSSDKAPEPDL